MGMQILVDQKQIEHNIFATYFTSNNMSGSSLSFGGPDSSCYTGSFTYVPVVNVTNLQNLSVMRGKWVVSASDIKIAGGSVGSCDGPVGCTVILDSGTSVLIGPSSMADPMIQQIGPVAKDCSNIDKLPTISFTFEGKEFDLGPDFYLIRIKLMGQHYCRIGIQSVPSIFGAPVWILGTPFLRKYYTVWDAEQQRVGFAHARDAVADSIDNDAVVDGRSTTIVSQCFLVAAAGGLLFLYAMILCVRRKQTLFAQPL